MNNQTNGNNLIEKIKNNYLSIILGLLVLLVIFSTLTKPSGQKQSILSQNNIVKQILNNAEDKATPPQVMAAEENIYVVKKGDNLWKIAESTYKSGYNYVDIAKTNKITNPDNIEVGQKLKLPEVKTKTPTITTTKSEKALITITASKYTVKKGDHLWKIALGAYGDGYSWVKIAKANKINSPDYIEVGQTLQIPR